MAIEAGNFQFSDVVNNQAPALTFTGVNIGDIIYFASTVSSADAHDMTISDDQGESDYPEIGVEVNDTTNLQEIRQFYRIATVAGTYVVTNTITAPASGDFHGNAGAVITGAAAVDPLVAFGPGQHQATPGTGTDAVTSGTAQTPSGTPCLVISFSLNDQTLTVPAAGTGFTSLGTMWDFGSTDGARMEWKRITGGNAQGTFTAAANESHITHMAAFLEATATDDGGARSAKLTTNNIMADKSRLLARRWRRNGAGRIYVPGP